MARILIADDEPSIRRVLAAHLKRDGYQAETAEDGGAAISLLQRAPFHLLVTDLRMPNVDGMALLTHCSERYPGMPVIVITAHGTVDSAVEALKLGAHDYITKPFDHDELKNVIRKALAHERRGRSSLHADNDGRFAIIGRARGMERIYALIEKVAPSPTTVLVQGESGTGKELVARALHDNSQRADGPFIQVNCGAIPDQLFESELFGYERGAFTGAVSDKPGRFELAHGGTLFLDEISELPRDMQVKLLRALQERTIERVGGIRSLSVDVRVIAATNRDLQAEVGRGAFREDLYYRLNVIPIVIPPLRERAGDIPLLAAHFLRKFNRRLGRQLDGLEPEALAALSAWHWPGNVRELENVMERAVLLAEDESIGLVDIHGIKPAETGDQADEGVQADEDAEDLGLKEYVRRHTVRLERSRIRRALELEQGNVTRAARRLGISRKSLQTKMKEYGLRDPPASSGSK